MIIQFRTILIINSELIGNFFLLKYFLFLLEKDHAFAITSHSPQLSLSFRLSVTLLERNCNLALHEAGMKRVAMSLDGRLVFATRFPLCMQSIPYELGPPEDLFMLAIN